MFRIEESLIKATKFANSFEFDLGWNQFFIAEQYLVKCMTPDQRIIKSNNIRVEASKLSGWRQEQIYLLLCRPGKDDNCINYPVIDNIDKINEALKIRNDYYNTRNHRMALRKASANTLAVLLSLILITIIVLSFFVVPINQVVSSFNQNSNQYLSLQIIYVVLFGMLGASFSLANSLLTPNMESKIPELLLGVYVTVIRLMIGGTAAFILFMLFNSGFLDSMFNKDMLKSPFIYAVISFISGFSERWVVGILDSITKDKDQEKNK
jgi:hypothetical protein